MRVSILVIAVAVAVLATGVPAKKIVCYFSSWAVYRTGNGAFAIEDIDTDHCTHINYAFASLNNVTYQLMPDDSWADLPSGLNGYQRFTGLTSRNPNLVPMLSVGGWSAGSVKFSEMVSSEANRQTFINSAVSYLGTYGFKGLDIDWEYPTQRNGTAADKENFVTLLQELKAAFAGPGYTLSAAVASDSSILAASYDIPGISQNLDHINLMLYDFHAYSNGDRTATHNAPLNSRPEENANANVEAAVQNWLDGGADPAKLILGTAAYGHSFQLQDAGNHNPGAPVVAPGAAGPISASPGTLLYSEICLNQWGTSRDDSWQAPYAYSGDQWVGYDDAQSIQAKCQFAVSKGLGGGMSWAIDQDDFKNLCGGGAYPLVTSLFNNC